MKTSYRIRKQLEACDGLPTAWTREDVTGLLAELAELERQRLRDAMAHVDGIRAAFPEIDENKSLRARVAELESALREALAGWARDDGGGWRKRQHLSDVLAGCAACEP